MISERNSFIVLIKEILHWVQILDYKVIKRKVQIPDLNPLIRKLEEDLKMDIKININQLSKRNHHQSN